MREWEDKRIFSSTSGASGGTLASCTPVLASCSCDCYTRAAAIDVSIISTAATCIVYTAARFPPRGVIQFNFIDNTRCITGLRLRKNPNGKKIPSLEKPFAHRAYTLPFRFPLLSFHAWFSSLFYIYNNMLIVNDNNITLPVPLDTTTVPSPISLPHIRFTEVPRFV